MADKLNSLTRWQWERRQQVEFTECLLSTREFALVVSFYLHDTPVRCLFPIYRWRPCVSRSRDTSQLITLKARCTQGCIWLKPQLLSTRLMLWASPDHRQVHRNNPRCKFIRDEESKHLVQRRPSIHHPRKCLWMSCCLWGIESGVEELMLTENQIIRTLLDRSWHADPLGRQPYTHTNTNQFVIRGAAG